MSYKDHLQRYGSPSSTGEARLYIYFQDPAKLEKAKDIEWRDRTAAQDIAQLEKLIADLREYRQALAARYAELETMLYTDRLHLERCPHWQGHIEYTVTITRRYEDGTETEQSREVYRGKDRKAAFARFEELKKQRPGITATKDTERRSWER